MVSGRTDRPLWRKTSGVGGDLEDARQYIDALQSQPPEAAIPRLIEILMDESWYLRDRAGKALASFGEHAAPAVEGLLAGALWYTRAAALRVLGELGAPRSLLRVVEFLGDSNRTISEAAAHALFGFCRKDRALATAKLLHAGGATPRNEAIGLLRRIDPEGTDRLLRLIDAADWMGPEGALSAAEQRRVAMEVSDRDWGISWELLVPSEPLPAPQRDLVRLLRGTDGA